MSISENQFPLIGDLSLRIEQEGDRYACIASLDMGIGQVPVKGGSFEVGFRRAYLKVDCNGFKIIKSSRYGIPIQVQQTTTKIKTQTQDQMNTEFSGGVEVEVSGNTTGKLASAAKAKANAEAGRSKATSSTAVTEEELTVQFVKARGGNTWEVGDKDRTDALNGNYLNDIVLFEFLSSAGSNRRSIEVQLIVQQGDMELEAHSTDGLNFGQNSWGAINRNKVSKVLAAKCLAKQHSLDAPYHGKFSISYIEEEVADEHVS